LFFFQKQFDVCIQWEDASNYPAVEVVRRASQASAAPDIARYQQDANRYRQVSGFPKSRHEPLQWLWLQNCIET